ncbi:3-hydroxyisobutyrate dehydrogenase [Nakamurella deserti]|uniref:3-hydroxyisobutyrate dehydrogenase n=1 Tax=Nakamurella deserti TaxID=2164074 RepID=UPI000DBE34F0|nr:3-hydroxyisobutyrate dehydrogenase [Nakamurella deserti]
MATIAWVGLGHMGAPMTARLVAAGHEVRGHDLDAEAVRVAVAGGVVAPGSLAAALDGADVLITMLQRGSQVRAVLAEALPLLPPGTLVIDSSTIAIDDARELHRTVAEAGLPFLDAPVSGGVPGATAGTLTFMVGGAAADLERARPVLEPMAGRIFHIGPGGSGQAAKIVNNLMLGITLAATCEGAVLADRLGLDHRVFQQMASVSSGDSWALRTWYPMPGVLETAAVNRDFDGGFVVDLMAKDLGLALAAGAATGTGLPFTAEVAAGLQRLRDAGLGGKDSSVFVKLVDGSLD